MAALAAGGFIWAQDNAVEDDGARAGEVIDWGGPGRDVPVVELEPGVAHPLYTSRGEEVGEVTLEEVARPMECANDDASEVEGERVGLRMTVVVPEDTDPDLAASVSVNPFSFEIEGDPEGYGANWFCVGSDAMVPLHYAAGEEAGGWVVLNVPEDAEAVLWDMTYTGRAPAYRIQLTPTP